MTLRPTIAFTNMQPGGAALTGWFRCLVPWSMGEVTAMSQLGTGKQIEFNGTARHVRWSEFGPRYRDGSVRYSVAEFQATMPADVGGNRPTVVATVQNGPNVQPTPDFTAFEAIWANTEIPISYTDPRNGQSYTINLLSVCRAGTNRATYQTTDIGMRRIVRAEAYFGRGTHNEILRAGGFNTQTAALSTNGNLHVRLWLEVTSGHTHAQGVISFLADAAYPSPSAPCDGGARDVFRPNRPTYLDPNAGEELDDPLGIVFDVFDPALKQYNNSSFYVEFSNSADIIAAHAWCVPIGTAGDSIWGRMPHDPISTGTRIYMPITALGDTQGWPFRFALSWEGPNSLDEARREALYPYTHVGMPTQETWMDTVKQGTLPAPYNGDTIAIKGGYEMPMVPATQQLLDQWFGEGRSWHTAFLNQDYGRLGYSSQERNWSWQMMGRQVFPPGSGAQPQLGIFREGFTWLANSPWRLYGQVCSQSREIGGARGAMIWNFEAQPLHHELVAQNNQLNDRLVTWVTGSNAPHWTSRDCKGRLQTVEGPWRDDYNAGAPYYQGSPSRRTNLSWTAESFPTIANWDVTNIWEPWDHGHFGMRDAWSAVVLTQDQYLSDMVEYTAHILIRRQVPNTFFGKNPADSTLRGEARINRGIYHAWLLTGKAVYRDAIARRMDQSVNGRLGNFDPIRRWAPWPIISSSDTKARYAPCGSGVGGVNKPQLFAAWQTSHWCVFAINWVFEFAHLYPDEMDTVMSTVREGIQAIIDNSCMVAPGNLSGGATRAIDACWATALAGRNSTEQQFAIAARFMNPRFVWVDPSDTAPHTLVADMTNESQSPSAWNGGENQDIFPTIRMYEVFADWRNSATFSERANFLIDRLLAIGGTSFGPEAHVGSKGYASDSWLPSGTFNPPTPIIATTTPRQGLAPLEVQFDATGSIVNGDLGAAVWRWWFEYDGNTASIPDLEDTIASNPGIQTPTHTYTQGTYTVRLEIEDSAGQANDIVESNYVSAEALVGAAPAADFVADVRSGPEPEFRVLLSDVSAPRPILSREWIITAPNGDQSFYSEESIALFLSAVGTYDVELTVRNAWGTGYVRREGYLEVTSVPAPAARFSMTPQSGFVPPDLVVTFTNQSTNAVAYLWDFGDGTTSTAANPGQHTYIQAGTYRTVLRAYNASGVWDEFRRTLPVGVVGSVDPVPVETTVVPEDTLVALTRIYNPSITASTGGQVVEADPLIATSELFDPTATINPSVTVAPGLLEATTTTFDPTAAQSYAGAMNFDDLGEGEGYLVATTHTFAPGVNSGDAHVTPPTQVATTFLFDPTTVAGTGRTVTPARLITHAALFAPAVQVRVDRTLEQPTLIARATTFAPLTGTRINVTRQAGLLTATATTLAPNVAVGDPVLFVYPGTLAATAVAFLPTAAGNTTPVEDEVELYGSIEAPTELEGSV